jgi:hypothetical protein
MRVADEPVNDRAAIFRFLFLMLLLLIFFLDGHGRARV